MKPHFILYVHDQKAATDFYSAVLEAEPRLHVLGMTEFELNDGAVLGLMPAVSASRLVGRNIDVSGLAENPCAEIYLIVDDPSAFHSRALQNGGTEISPLKERDWGHDAAYSTDLSGHVLAFAREL
ncbi:MAG: glyoxalase [Chloracidobacterium sp.]|nr:glyoxalase [Chloracidobacterium sp.]